MVGAACRASKHIVAAEGQKTHFDLSDCQNPEPKEYL